jgi:hypothetical protein
MIVVESMFFDSDDYQVESEVIPCESKDVAKKVADKIYEKLLEDYDFDEEDPDENRESFERRYVKKHKDGSYNIDGSDCGYGWIKIVDREAVTADTVSALEPVVGNIY